jgi:hypothetical protein
MMRLTCGAIGKRAFPVIAKPRLVNAASGKPEGGLVGSAGDRLPAAGAVLCEGCLQF